MHRNLRRRPLLSTVLGLLSIALIACSENSVDPNKIIGELEAASAAYDEAILEQDSATLERIYSEAYQDVGPDGVIRGRQEKIASLTDPDARLLSAQSDEVAIEVFGDVALVTGRFSGRFLSDGQEVRFSERFSTLWVLDGNQWRLRYEQVSEIPTED